MEVGREMQGVGRYYDEVESVFVSHQGESKETGGRKSTGRE